MRWDDAREQDKVSDFKFFLISVFGQRIGYTKHRMCQRISALYQVWQSNLIQFNFIYVVPIYNTSSQGTFQRKINLIDSSCQTMQLSGGHYWNWFKKFSV